MEEGEDGGGQGRGPGSPMTTKGTRNMMPLRAWTASHITKDMLPMPYPRTLEEQATAAKQYNMRVEDYEPYPGDGMGYGDYRKLPDRSKHERDPWYNWDHSELRLNWDGRMHWNLDKYMRNRVDTSPTLVSWNVMCKQLLGFMAFMIFMFWVGHVFPSYQLVGPKQYPYNNLHLEGGGDPTKEPGPVVDYEI